MPVPAPAGIRVDLEKFRIAVFVKTPVEPAVATALPAFKEGDAAPPNPFLGPFRKLCRP